MNGILYCLTFSSGNADRFTATVTVLSESDDWAALCNAERAQIKAMRTMVSPGFNLTAGGDGVPGYRQSPADQRRKGAAP